MHAHLVPLPSGPDSPSDVLASCRLDAGDRSWQLVLTDRSGPYEVEDVWSNPGGGFGWAMLVEFDGPRDAAQVEADRRSGRDRVWPAASQVEGVSGALVLRAAADGAMVVVSFADSPASLEAARLAILSTPLLPGEDPAMLGGPTRGAECAVRDDDGVATLLRTSGAPAVSA